MSEPVSRINDFSFKIGTVNGTGSASANSSLALAEPEPLTLAKRITKSFTLLIGLWTDMMFPRKSYR